MSIVSGNSSRKRTAASPPSSVSDRSAKRSRVSLQDEDDDANTSIRALGQGIPTHFRLPSNPEDLSEANLTMLLSGDQDQDAVPNTHILPIRRLSNFTLFYADTTHPKGLHELAGLETLQKRDGTNTTRVILAHGAARVDDVDLDEAAFEGNLEGDDNQENPGPPPLQFHYCEVILDPIEAWWVGNGISNACVSLPFSHLFHQ